MASNKNQHFVPRCYLRPFTSDGKGKSINVYNIDRARLIPRAPVKNQCSRNYFYGEDLKVEKHLQIIEGAYAEALRAIESPGYMLSEEHRQFLKQFWFLQYSRTEAFSKQVVGMADDTCDLLNLEGSEYKIELRDATIIGLSNCLQHGHSVADLKVCLVRNRTSLPFITSDDPAVLTNRWHLHDPRTRFRAFGVSAAGSILLLPLSPTLLCIAYDGDVYSIPNKRGWVDLRNVHEVEALNQHQFLNCRANIFTHDPDYVDDIEAAYARASPQRPAAKYRINYTVKDYEADGMVRYRVIDPNTDGTQHEGVMLHTESIHPVPNIWPRLLQWRHKGYVFTNGTGVGYVRKALVEPDLYQPYWREPARLR